MGEPGLARISFTGHRAQARRSVFMDSISKRLTQAAQQARSMTGGSLVNSWFTIYEEFFEKFFKGD